MDKRAVQRLTHTLENLGLLSKNSATKRVSLTVRVLSHGASFLASSELIRTSVPYMQHLSKEAKETVGLSVLDGDEVVFISRFLNRHFLHSDMAVGYRMPAYCAGPGCAILRHPWGCGMTLLKESKRSPITLHTIWQLDKLEQELAVTRTPGYATAFISTSWEIFRLPRRLWITLAPQLGR